MKRFTDTTIWDRPWFRALRPEEKEAWRYVTDHCDNVGVWIPDFYGADFHIGEVVAWTDLPGKCNGNIEVLSDGKWWLKDFCDFQYGELKENCKPHQSYIALLKKHRLLKGYTYPIDRVQEKEEEKEIDKDIEKDKEKDSYVDDFNLVWKMYPRKVNRKGAYKKYVTRRREGIEASEMMRAVTGYVASVKADGTEQEFMLHGATFFGPNERWKEYMAYKPKKQLGATNVKSWTCAKCGKVWENNDFRCYACGEEK